MGLSELQLDLLDLARTTAAAGGVTARRAVMKLCRKHQGTELGVQLRNVCRDHGIPVDVTRDSADPALVHSNQVLRASEAMDRLVAIAKGDETILAGFRVAFDYVLSDYGPPVVRGQLELLVKQGQVDAAVVLGQLLQSDDRKTYAAAGTALLRRLRGDREEG